MSDEEKEIDVESDYDDDSRNDDSSGQTFNSLEEKRAHHNALERKRRDHIKDSFVGLRDSIPTLEGEKSSRAQILAKASDHIQYLRRKNHMNQSDIDELKRHNSLLSQQVRELEKARANGTLPLEAAEAGLLSPHLLHQPMTENDFVQADPNLLVKNEPVVVIERPNNAGDHDDYTIAPKRRKIEPN